MKIIICILFLITTKVTAQEYAVTLIPDSLKDNANAVLRAEEVFVNISDIDKAVVKHKYAITILNEHGDGFGAYSGQYDKLKKLSDISGTLYDANGVKIKSLKRKEIMDFSDDGSSFWTDNRTKEFSFQHKNYPYTVEFEDEKTYDGIFYLPYWMPVAASKMAVQKSKFLVETSNDYKLRYKQINFDNKPAIASSKKTTYSWQLNNYKAFSPEAFMPNLIDALPCVLLAPTNFSIEGYKGNMTTWKDFGNFLLQLNQNRNEIPETLKQELLDLVKACKTDEEKIFKVYEFMQNQTRYISIQLGIGGWQTLPASFVAQKKYGDCKALSNYTVSLLSAVGIKANYAVIMSGKNVSRSLFEDFPCSFANHMIACVPLKNDTIWLECTDQKQSAGYCGTHTGNRKAILITDEGGVVVNTPQYKATENLCSNKVTATIDAVGNLKLNCVTTNTGTEQEEAWAMHHYLSNDEKIKAVNKRYDMAIYEVTTYAAIEAKSRLPKMTETFSINASAYANITGKRMFIVPNLLTHESRLDEDLNRKFDIVFYNAYTNTDTIQLKIPEGYIVEMMPKNCDIINKFGSYKIHYTYGNGQITIERFYQQQTNTFPASDYKALAAFYNEMAKADKAKLVLVKKD